MIDVYYAVFPDEEAQGRGFGRPIEWGMDLLSGYNWYCSKRTAIKKIDLYKFWMGYPSRRVSAQLRNGGYDCGLVMGWNSSFLVGCAAILKRSGIPVLVRGDSNVESSRYGNVRFVHQILFRLFDGFLYVGSRNKSFYGMLGIPETKLFPSCHFVDNDFFGRWAKHARNAVEGDGRSYGVSCPVRFLYVGKLEEKKRLNDLLEACHILSSSGMNIVLDIVGQGDQEGRLRERAGKMNIQVNFHGFVDQVNLPRWYAKADCLVLPSDHRETWGLVVNEAMASGLPAIVSDMVGCVEDLVLDGITGFRYSCGDIHALVEKMKTIAVSTTLRQKIGRAAQRHVRRYSVETASRGLVQAVDDLLSPRRHKQQ